MAFSFPVREAIEGAARILVPDVPRRRGPGSRGPWPFYNPTTAVSRDVSAVVLRHWPRRVRTVLDGLAATGIWGIRMGLEAHVDDLRFNDRRDDATALIRQNLDRNGLQGAVTSKDLRVLLEGEAAFDVLDVDPFGPPTPFLEAVFAAARIGSGIGLTATDTAPLSGTYPGACMARYGARPLRCDQGPEIGLRILVGCCARVASKHGKGIRPLLAYRAEHFLRAHLVIESEDSLGALGEVVRASPGQFRTVDRGSRETIGPLWLGLLADPGFLETVTPSEFTGPEAARLMARCKAEAPLPPFYVTTDELSRDLRAPPPKVRAFVEGLRELGFAAVHTHFHPRGVKTDAPHEDIARVFREQSPSGSTDGSGPAT